MNREEAINTVASLFDREEAVKIREEALAQLLKDVERQFSQHEFVLNEREGRLSQEVETHVATRVAELDERERILVNREAAIVSLQKVSSERLARCEALKTEAERADKARVNALQKLGEERTARRNAESALSKLVSERDAILA